MTTNVIASVNVSVNGTRWKVAVLEHECGDSVLAVRVGSQTHVYPAGTGDVSRGLRTLPAAVERALMRRVLAAKYAEGRQLVRMDSLLQRMVESDQKTQQARARESRLVQTILDRAREIVRWQLIEAIQSGAAFNGKGDWLVDGGFRSYLAHN